MLICGSIFGAIWCHLGFSRFFGEFFRFKKAPKTDPENDRKNDQIWLHMAPKIDPENDRHADKICLQMAPKIDPENNRNNDQLLGRLELPTSNFQSSKLEV